MTTMQAIILGVLEGLTEFLPISSTGHLTLASHFLGIIQNDQFIVFEIAIQLGAILAVIVFYWKRFFNIELLAKLFTAFLPTGLLGLFVYKYIKTLLTSELVVASTLILGGIVLIIVENIFKKKSLQNLTSPANKEGSQSEVSYKQSFLLGLAQSVAMIPGVSRSGATIVTGLLMNIERKILVEFTFLLAVPTMSIATLYSIYKNKDILSADNFLNIFFGFITSFIVALVVIKFLLNYVKKYDFIPFAIYRIILGIVVFITFF